MARTTPAQKPRGAQSRMSSGGLVKRWGKLRSVSVFFRSGAWRCQGSASRACAIGLRIASRTMAPDSPQIGRCGPPLQAIPPRPTPIKSLHGRRRLACQLPAADPDLLRRRGDRRAALPQARAVGGARLSRSRRRDRPLAARRDQGPRRDPRHGRDRRRAAALPGRARIATVAALLDAQGHPRRRPRADGAERRRASALSAWWLGLSVGGAVAVGLALALSAHLDRAAGAGASAAMAARPMAGAPSRSCCSRTWRSRRRSPCCRCWRRPDAAAERRSRPALLRLRLRAARGRRHRARRPLCAEPVLPHPRQVPAPRR